MTDVANMTPPRVDSMTRRFLALESRVTNPADVYFGLFLRCAGPVPTLANLRAHVADRIGLLPALTHRVADGPRWEPATAFDIAEHVYVLEDAPVTAVAPGKWLDGAPGRDRPLWRMWLLPGDGVTWGLAMVVHHACQDGTALVRSLEILFGDAHAPRIATARTSHRSAALRAVPNLLSTVRAAPELAVMGPLSGERRLRHVTVPLTVVRRIAGACGATVGQVHLAALAGAVRRWSPGDFGERGRDLPVCVPVDTRTAAEHSSTEGNRIGLLRVPLPAAGDDPRVRLRTAVRRLSRRRTALVRTALRSLVDDVPPHWSRRAQVRIGARRNVAFTASVFRPVGQLDILGGVVEEVVGVPFLAPGHGCSTILATSGDKVTFSVLTDTGVDETRDLAGCWAAEIAELDEAVGH